MKIWLTTTFLFVCVSFSYTQNTKTEIIGKVVHFDIPISDAHIFNLTTHKGASSNLDGNFEITVKLGDTIHISHLEYTNKEIEITEEIINQRALIVYLDIMTNYLNVVEIRDHDLLGVLASDSRSVSIDSLLKASTYIDKILEAAKIGSNQDFAVNPEAPYMNDVSKIKMNGVGSSIGIPMKDKENILRRKLRTKRNTPDKIISDFGIPFFTDKLDISEDKIHNFLTYCDYRNIIQLYQENKVIEVLTILEEESVEYNKIRTD